MLIQHTGKGDKEHAQHRVLGSTGIVATCRAVWGVYVDPNDKSKRIFAPVKVNCGYNHTAISYKIAPPDGVVEIAETSIENMTGDDIAYKQRQANEKKGRPAAELIEAMEWLQDFLADGDKPQSEIMEAAQADGLKERTIYRARGEIGIESIRGGRNGPRRWRLPTTITCQNTD